MPMAVVQWKKQGPTSHSLSLPSGLRIGWPLNCLMELGGGLIQVEAWKMIVMPVVNRSTIVK